MSSNYLFNTDWFTAREAEWLKVLGHLAFKKSNFLEIGSYEGRSAMWTADNLCVHDDSKLICIDPWTASAATDRMRLFMSNLAKCEALHKVQVIRDFSWRALHQFRLYSFDCIYIDGWHRAECVLEDAVLCLRLVRKGGYIIFDDYKWTPTEAALAACSDQAEYRVPKIGIDIFLDMYGNQFEIVHQGWQIILRKL